MKSIYQAGMLLLVATFIFGIIYPSLVTMMGGIFWPDKINGSLVKIDDNVVGSSLIAQAFTRAIYFWPRPSASDYSALPSQASNLGPTSAALRNLIADRIAHLAKIHNVPSSHIPMDLVTTSASGLDPHISEKAARVQIPRIVKARGLRESDVMLIEKLVDDNILEPEFGIFGERRINVLLLNLSLDKTLQQRSS